MCMAGGKYSKGKEGSMTVAEAWSPTCCGLTIKPRGKVNPVSQRQLVQTQSTLFRSLASYLLVDVNKLELILKMETRMVKNWQPYHLGKS